MVFFAYLSGWRPWRLAVPLMLPGRPLWQRRRLLVDGIWSGGGDLGLDVLADGQGLVPGARRRHPAEDGLQGLVHPILLALGGGHAEGERPGLGGVGGGRGDRVVQHAPRLGPLDGDAPVGGAGQVVPPHGCVRARVPPWTAPRRPAAAGPGYPVSPGVLAAAVPSICPGPVVAHLHPASTTNTGAAAR